MSAICQNFVQNAWKKELCSNCFKSRDEHASPKSKVKTVTLTPAKSVEGIIKNTSRKKPKRNVNFNSQLVEVIGFGGEDWSESEPEEEEVNEESNDSEPEFGDDDRELQRVTKANTDFNACSLKEIESKKSYTQLMLGKPQVDSEGRKQTLLVSVTPFGQDNKIKTKPVSHIPIAKNKDNIENKAVVLTAYTKSEDKVSTEEKSLLDEISETLENGKNPIQIITRKKTQKEIVLSIPKPENLANKENIERKNGLSRNPVIKRDEKPVIYQTAIAKIELMNNKNSQLNKELTEIKEETIINKVETESTTDDSSINSSCEESAKDDSDTSSEKMTSYQNMKYSKSRELAGEPDGRADPDNKEPPALPLSPPPNLETNQISNHTPFITAEKPKIATKPSTILIRKPMISNQQLENQNVLTTFSVELVKPEESKTKLVKTDSDGSDVAKFSGKRRAPKPPEESAPIYTRNSAVSTDSPVVREKEKRERASSCTPKMRVTSSAPQIEYIDIPQPEPAPRRSLSLSTDNLTHEEKKKDKRGRFSLKKFLRMGGTSKEIKHTEVAKRSDEEPSPEAKPRLIIVHPLDLQGKQVEVVKQQEIEPEPDYVYRAAKPPPPPRHYDEIKPNLPHPPKSAELLKKHRGQIRNLPQKTDTVYANIGEVRSAITPNKPQRTASMREREAQQTKNGLTNGLSNMYASNNGYSGSNTGLHNGSNVGLQNCSNIGLHTGSNTGLHEGPSNGLHEGSSNALHSGSSNGPHGGSNSGSHNGPHSGSNQGHYNGSNHGVHNGSNHGLHDGSNNGLRNGSNHGVHNGPNHGVHNGSNAGPHSNGPNTNGNYEPINIRSVKQENVYDYINGRSSSPESEACNNGKNSLRIKKMRNEQRSGSSIDVSSEYYKYNNCIPRSVSLTYCGSETESEIYSPYSCYGSESEIAEDDHDWNNTGGRTHKLRSRKGRSIVHKNLEDNYGAVVIANHEALAQVLENIQHTLPIQPALRGLKTAANLRWSDFSVKSSSVPFVVGSRAFHQALWGAQQITILISSDSVPTGPLALGAHSMVPITEFSDLIPVKYLPLKSGHDTKHLQATVAVLPYMQVNTIQTYGEMLAVKSQNGEEIWKEASFVLLQLVNALKTLQAQGFEELPLSLTSFVLFKEMEKETNIRLCVLQGLGEDVKKEEGKVGSLCTCVLAALKHLQPNAKLAPLLSSLLSTERAVSLSQVKSVLEFSLWGPSDVALGSTVRERESALQRWLDLQRATVLHGLVCTKVHLTIYEECHLLFLVRSNARMMCDASLLLDSSHIQKLAH